MEGDSAPGLAVAGEPTPRRWTGRELTFLAAGLLAAAVLRALLLPTVGLRDDTDQFAGWIHRLATDLPLGQAYRMDLTFGPVMTYLFWLMGQVQPAFQTATDASDPLVRATIKLPASAADIGLVVVVAWLLRDRPRVAIVAACAIAFVPVTWFVSAWWGQFESIYALFGLLAAAAALSGRPLLAGVALGLAVSTKPQALPFLLPFAAWILARFGWRGTARAAVGGLLAVLAAWLPFLADGGHVAYLRNIAAYQDGDFAVMSLRAWNPWWILQSSAAGDAFLPDNVPILGPLTARMIGYGFAAVLSLLVAALVLRAREPRGLLLGAAAGILVAFLALTTMHERYSFAALVFLAPLLADRRVAAAWAVLAGVTFANYLAAIPIVPGEPPLLPIDGPLGIAGSAVITGVAIGVGVLLAEEGRRRARATTARGRSPPPAAPERQPSTSAGSAGATSEGGTGSRRRSGRARSSAPRRDACPGGSP